MPDIPPLAATGVDPPRPPQGSLTAARDARTAPSPPPTPEPQPEPAPAAGANPAIERLQRELERVLARNQTTLRFRVDDETRRVIVRVIDGTGETVLQIPTEAALQVARNLARLGRGLLDDHA